jgi:hypothetical protein
MADSPRADRVREIQKQGAVARQHHIEEVREIQKQGAGTRQQHIEERAQKKALEPPSQKEPVDRPPTNPEIVSPQEQHTQKYPVDHSRSALHTHEAEKQQAALARRQEKVAEEQKKEADKIARQEETLKLAQEQHANEAALERKMLAVREQKLGAAAAEKRKEVEEARRKDLAQKKQDADRRAEIMAKKRHESLLKQQVARERDREKFATVQQTAEKKKNDRRELLGELAEKQAKAQQASLKRAEDAKKKHAKDLLEKHHKREDKIARKLQEQNVHVEQTYMRKMQAVKVEEVARCAEAHKKWMHQQQEKVDAAAAFAAKRSEDARERGRQMGESLQQKGVQLVLAQQARVKRAEDAAIRKTAHLKAVHQQRTDAMARRQQQMWESRQKETVRVRLEESARQSVVEWSAMNKRNETTTRYKGQYELLEEAQGIMVSARGITDKEAFEKQIAKALELVTKAGELKVMNKEAGELKAGGKKAGELKAEGKKKVLGNREENAYAANMERQFKEAAKQLRFGIRHEQGERRKKEQMAKETEALARSAREERRQKHKEWMETEGGKRVRRAEEEAAREEVQNREAERAAKRREVAVGWAKEKVALVRRQEMVLEGKKARVMLKNQEEQKRRTMRKQVKEVEDAQKRAKAEADEWAREERRTKRLVEMRQKKGQQQKARLQARDDTIGRGVLREQEEAMKKYRQQAFAKHKGMQRRAAAYQKKQEDEEKRVQRINQAAVDRREWERDLLLIQQPLPEVEVVPESAADLTGGCALDASAPEGSTRPTSLDATPPACTRVASPATGSQFDSPFSSTIPPPPLVPSTDQELNNFGSSPPTLDMLLPTRDSPGTAPADPIVAAAVDGALNVVAEAVDFAVTESTRAESSVHRALLGQIAVGSHRRVWSTNSSMGGAGIDGRLTQSTCAWSGCFTTTMTFHDAGPKQNTKTRIAPAQPPTTEIVEMAWRREKESSHQASRSPAYALQAAASPLQKRRRHREQRREQRGVPSAPRVRFFSGDHDPHTEALQRFVCKPFVSRSLFHREGYAPSSYHKGPPLATSGTVSSGSGGIYQLQYSNSPTPPRQQPRKPKSKPAFDNIRVVSPMRTSCR